MCSKSYHSCERTLANASDRKRAAFKVGVTSVIFTS
jgi:hypothetical protein